MRKHKYATPLPLLTDSPKERVVTQRYTILRHAHKSRTLRETGQLWYANTQVHHNLGHTRRYTHTEARLPGHRHNTQIHTQR